MQPQPITIIIRSNQTSQFQETTGLLYVTKQGENNFYTAIVEKENINAAGYQVLDNNKSPLQFILEQLEKTRKKAEIIADRIIEEIILQKSKQQMQSKLIKEQSQELQKLTDDLQQQNLDTRSMSGIQRQASISSLDFNLKRSYSHNQLSNMNQFIQKKNELILQIDKQIERNIKEEQNNIPSFDNISVSSKITPRGGSPKLNELRNRNKSRNQLSPEKKISLNKVINLEERLETDISTSSNNNIIPLLNLQTASGNQFDLKEYMKQAVLQGNTGASKPANQHHTTHHDIAEQTPAFNLNKKLNTVSQFTSSLSHLDELQGGDSFKHQFEKHKEDMAASSLANSQKIQNNQAEKQMIYNNLDSFSVQNPHSDNVFVISNKIPQRLDLAHISKTGTRLSLAKRNVERDKLKMAHAEGDNKSSQFKKASAEQKSSNNNVLEINFADLREQKGGQKENTQKVQRKSEKEIGQVSNGGGQINDFIAKINMMLQKSANINAQVEQSMIDSEKNLQQLESLSNLTSLK